MREYTIQAVKLYDCSIIFKLLEHQLTWLIRFQIPVTLMINFEALYAQLTDMFTFISLYFKCPTAMAHQFLQLN
jgi:hypothetical protein